ncbi:hypothetical protein [Kitasatospora sp. NPDC004272]
MTVRVPLRFSRTTDLGCHGDLLLELGGWRHECDSYYLAIDDSPRAGADIARGLVRLLDQWLEQLERLPQLGTGGRVFLPFDFSDEYTGWLRVSNGGGGPVTVEAGWSGAEGWSFHPSDVAGTAELVRDFKPIDGAGIECGLGDLVAAVTGNRAELGAGAAGGAA